MMATIAAATTERVIGADGSRIPRAIVIATAVPRNAPAILSIVAMITDDTRVYLRDCYDHIIQIIDLLENYREIASGLMDVYLSSVSNRMNEVMKVLTIFAVILIPLTFIARIYGMNFDPQASPYNMPELHSFFGYPVALAIMVLVAMGMIVYFRRKGWIGAPRGKPSRGEIARG
jgi:magnesium transporter